ncbi:ABC transporter ATP-binding protein [Pseudooceanicola pacificus]|jgi:branched-chain amino acid transport system ATP-binding protein|nr:ABC transporter ATP-binding protein [Pseudooceanicola pacificus]
MCKSFGGFQAVEGVNLHVAQGTIHAMVGPNGAGKTTCFNLITRFLDVSKGQIIFDGKDVTKRGASHVAKDGLVRSFQISAIFPDMTLIENVRFALQQRRMPAMNFWGSAARLSVLEDEAMQLIEHVGLGAYANQRAATLPYGRKRALEIATTLAMEPKVMLLDEPTAGMGHEDIERITEVIRKAAVGRSVLMVEHNLRVVSELSDRVTVLARGQVLTEGSYAEVADDPRVKEAYLGTAA